ncbi:helix-turn-helix transcriptional regulator [Aurantimonas sp. 22II-16-19i]|uniref:helix-turn-helix domain-containing protein n=1 Tax=Aurantimonas sp. 22II-16-19i TaxID=1317114 RepID=UPI0009F7AC3E|nr:helix-turn-helix transcriptional regulator [Aurantimonas sp. 22II-16-19i]ORE97778.1 transcriptional regulator [Aurantimonas sp. 22II-16-19i]
MRSLDDVKKGLPPERLARVEKTAKSLLRAEGLRQLRKGLNRTQHEVAEATGMSQYNVSRLESRDDMLLSTLNRYVEGLGGRLRVIAEMPGDATIEIDIARKAPVGDARKTLAQETD